MRSGPSKPHTSIIKTASTNERVYNCSCGLFIKFLNPVRNNSWMEKPYIRRINHNVLTELFVRSVHLWDARRHTYTPPFWYFASSKVGNKFHRYRKKKFSWQFAFKYHSRLDSIKVFLTLNWIKMITWNIIFADDTTFISGTWSIIWCFINMMITIYCFCFSGSCLPTGHWSVIVNHQKEQKSYFELILKYYFFRSWKVNYPISFLIFETPCLSRWLSLLQRQHWKNTTLLCCIFLAQNFKILDLERMCPVSWNSRI